MSKLLNILSFTEFGEKRGREKELVGEVKYIFARSSKTACSNIVRVLYARVFGQARLVVGRSLDGTKSWMRVV